MRLFGGKRASRRLVEVSAGMCAIALTTSAATALDALAGAWLPSQPLSDVGATMYSSTDAREVVVAPDGTVLAVWLGPDGNHSRVHARIRTPGGRFGSIQVLSAPGEMATTPQLAVDRKGTAIAMWSTNGQVHYAIRPPGESRFGRAAPALSLPAVDDAQFGAPGEAVAIWKLGDREIRAAVRPPGGEFDAPQTIDTLDRHGIVDGRFRPPTMAADGGGTIYASWSVNGWGATGTSDIAALRASISTAVRPPSGPFGPGPALDSNCAHYVQFGPCIPGYPTLAASHESGAVVAWYVQGERGNSFSPAASLPDGMVLLTGGGFGSGLPLVALDGRGAVTLAWADYRDFRLRTQPPSGPVQEGPTGHHGVAFGLAADGVGRTYAVWTDAVWAEGYIRALVRNAAGRFSSARDLVLSGRGAGPDVVADRSGNALATWVNTDATGSALYFAPFDGAAPQLGRLRVPKRGRTGKRLGFSVAPTDVWSPIVRTVWRFGDGKTASGARPRHTYRYAGGTFKARVTVTDAAGNSATKLRRVRIRDVTRPRITGFRARRGGLRFRLTERARVRIVVSRAAAGVPSHVRTLVRIRRKPGLNRVTFKGRPGRYYATIVATDRTGHPSRPKSTRFRIR
jgi:hypothetical protein